jgi:hypothetical protein
MKRILFGASILIVGAFASDSKISCNSNEDCKELHHECYE